MRRIYLKRFLISLLSVIFILGLIPLTTSCTPELSFGDLVICEDINQDTFEPINAKNEFDIEAKNICACIEYFGAKGGDSYRFNWINTDTGEDALDKTGEYAEGESGYFDGCAYSSSSLSGS